MSDVLKICEHESVEWIFKRIPKINKRSFLKKISMFITTLDANLDVFVFGTNTGNIFIFNRVSNVIEEFLLKKNFTVCFIKLIHSIDLSIAVGFNDGSIFILNIPFNDRLILSKMTQFIVPVGHKSLISHMTWSKNAEKLFSGDINGLVYCTEINYLDKTVSSYEICKTEAKIVQLAYDHKCLIISNEIETYMWNFSTSSRNNIGTLARNKNGTFGVAFVNKLCISNEIEIIVARPKGKIWISDSNGTVKRSIVLNTDIIFIPDKLISLLPCVTSKSKNEYIDDIKTQKTKFQLGKAIPIYENEILFWSENAIVIINLINGNIVSSSYNLGKIQAVSICEIDKLIKNKSTSSVDCLNDNQKLFEIWILREPLFENDNKLVRLSAIPLMTSKLLIDPFYFYSQAKIANINDNIKSYYRETISNADSTIDKPIIPKSKSEFHNEENLFEVLILDKPVEKQSETFITKIEEIKNTIEDDLRSNILDLSKFKKEVMKQGQAIFTSLDEGVEQALELTEEGLIIQFEQPSVPTPPVSIERDHNLDILTLEAGKIPPQRNRRANRKIELIELDDEPQKSDTILPKSNDEVFQTEKSFFIPEANYDLSNHRKLSDDNYSDLFNPDEFSPYNETSLSHQISDDLSPVFSDNEAKLSGNFVTDSESFEISKMSNDNVLNFDIPMDTLNHSIVQSIESNELIDQNNSDIISFVPSQDSVKEEEKEKENYKLFENSIHSRTSSNSNCDFQISQTLKYNDNISYQNIVEFDTRNKKLQSFPSEEEEIQEIEYHNHPDLKMDEELILSNSIFLKCNKWLSHRGPTLSSNAKLTSMTVNRSMIWLADSKGFLYVGFKKLDSDFKDIDLSLTVNHKMTWLTEPGLRTDKISSSPNGFILWREKAGEVSVYTGMTRIWTPKVVKEKVLLKTHWESTMQGIKEIDIDEEMAVIVTKKGQLKVINGISSRTPYRQCSSVNITGIVTMATVFNGIIWCVTEVDMNISSKMSQHLFACVARDENGDFNISYWRTVPLAKDLVKEDEQNFGVLGGSELIRSIQLGTNCLAWIVTLDNMCFFSQNITYLTPAGDGIWYQISLEFLLQTPSFEENVLAFSVGIQNRVEKMLGYTDTEAKIKRTSSLNNTPVILMSVKCAPKRAKGNGLLWITSIERSAPCVIFESDKNILGHHWVDCFPIHTNEKKRLPGLPALTSWTCVEIASFNTLWLLHKSGEVFAYWKENKIRTVSMPISYGKITRISARNSTVAALTSKSRILIRIGIIESNPFGTDWREINKKWNNKEIIRDISCAINQLWIISDNNIYYNEDLQAVMYDTSKKLPWNLLNFKIKDSNNKRLSMIQNSKSGNINTTWAISDPDGYIYMTQWESSSNKQFQWTYIPGRRAKSIHVSDENLWIIEQNTGNIFIRCGLDWKRQPMGDYWIPVPLMTPPTIDLSVSSNNQVFVIDGFDRLLLHRWTIIEGNSTSESQSELQFTSQTKTDDHDWELLN